MELIEIKINGKSVSCEPDKTILEVVRENKIDDIPTLCHDPRIEPYGSCYVCVVEVEGLQKLVPSCCSQVSKGMSVITRSDRIMKARKMALELLLSNHYADCIAPCKKTCPAGVDVQGYIALIANKKYKEAIALIKETNPLPLICGRVCVRECEIACRRNILDEGLGIDFLKRYVADMDIEDPWQPSLKPLNGMKIAIVGGGPAGLTCAYYLRKEGYSPVIFEKMPHLGGMLRYGIPEYRLPKSMLDKEIKWITNMGVQVYTGKELGKDFTISSLKKDGYNAIFLALGAQKAKKMGVKNEENIKGIVGGIDFLRDFVNTGKSEKLKKVVVIGGGNTAIDAARTSLRLGAKEVIILYRRTREEMPANAIEIDAALHEGIDIRYLSAPVEIIEKKGVLKALKCIKMKLGEPDKSGRRSPIPIEGSEYDLDCDYAISAIGQDIDLCGIREDCVLKTTKWNGIVVDENSLSTDEKGIYAGGDAVTGPKAAIDAIAHGLKAAKSIDRFLKGGNGSGNAREFLSRKDAFGDISMLEFENTEKMKKEEMQELEPELRIKSFKEVELGYTSKQAERESSRCLECGCNEYFDCSLRKYADDYGVDISKYLGEVRKYKVDKSHPFILIDSNKCISCGRCVRTCSQILEVSALGFINRGFRSVVKPAMEKKLQETNCISCGNCIDTCPTGALSERLPAIKPAPFRGIEYDGICSFCSTGCNLKYKVMGKDLFTVKNASGDTHNRGYLCVKGRFGYRYMLDDRRNGKALMNKDGRFAETDIENAINEITRKLRHYQKSFGNDSIAVFASSGMTNEELYLLQKFTRTVLKNNNISSLSNLLKGVGLNSLDRIMGFTSSTTNTDEFENADLIMLVNTDLASENLVMELKIKQAMKKGAKLIVLSPSETSICRTADLWIDLKRGSSTALFCGLMNALMHREKTDTEFIKNRTEGYENLRKSISGISPSNVLEMTGINGEKLDKLFNMVSDNKNLITVYNIDRYADKSVDDIKAITSLHAIKGSLCRKGNGIIVVRDYCNSTGVLNNGVSTEYLPGFVGLDETDWIKKISDKWETNLTDIFRKNDIKAKLLNGAIKAALIFGEDPLCDVSNIKFFDNIEFMVVSDIFQTATTERADIFLPMAIPLESSGSYTSCDGRIQYFNRVKTPENEYENWEVITGLYEKLGSKTSFKSVKDINSEISFINRCYKNKETGFLSLEEVMKDMIMLDAIKISLQTFKPQKISYIASENSFNLTIKKLLDV
ncbi:MAG: FAD-dependent oxidoreductase [Candidatus Coatesbacteria bacterium]|nr:FAD-dependent oxidoreductase [Candidatus Coatesbacteria bacterium]